MVENKHVPCVELWGDYRQARAWGGELINDSGEGGAILG